MSIVSLFLDELVAISMFSSTYHIYEPHPPNTYKDFIDKNKLARNDDIQKQDKLVEAIIQLQSQFGTQTLYSPNP